MIGRHMPREPVELIELGERATNRMRLEHRVPEAYIPFLLLESILYESS